MQSSTIRATLLGSVSTAAAIFLLPADAQAQTTTCSQAGTTITCVDGTTTVLTGTTTAGTTVAAGPGLTLVDTTTTPSVTAYTASGTLATTGTTAITVASPNAPISLVRATGSTGINVSTTGGAGANGVTLITPGQAATVAVGTVSTTGTNSFGVFSGGGTDLNLRTSNVSVTGAGSTAIDAAAQTGNVAVATANVTAANRGLRVLTTGTNSVVTADVTTGERAIFATGSSVSLISRNITTSTNGGTTPGGYAVNVQAANGDASVSTGAISTANGFGVSASSATGNTTVTTGSVAATNGYGIQATGAGSVTVNGCSNVSTTGNNADAIFARSSGANAVTVNCGAVSTTGNNSAGVIANSKGGNVAVTVTSASTTGVGSVGVSGGSQGTGNVTINGGTITTTGAGGTGLAAATGTGALDVGYGNITTSGVRDGSNSASALFLATGGAANVRGSGATLQTNGAGVSAAEITAAGVTGNLGNVRTTGTGSAGAVINSTAPVTLTVGTVTTTGNALTVNAGASAVTLTTGAVTATGSGSTGTVITSTGPVTFTGGRQAANGASALRIFGGAGAISATTAGAAVTGTGTAVRITGTGALTYTDTGTISTTGSFSDGVNLTTTGGPLVVTTNQVTTTGATGSRGIVATAAGNVTINAGTTTVTGANADAIRGTSTAGSVAATVTGTTSALELNGISLQGATTATATIGAGSTVFGANYGVRLTSVTGSTVNNAGTISGNNGAIGFGGGAATVNNSGTLTGRLVTTDNADTINNSGTFNSTGVNNYFAGNDVFNNSGTYNANANSDFGAGTDVFNNTGTFRVLNAATAAGTVSFLNLETFNNSNLIDLRNGRTGDVFSTSGAYVGSGNATIGLNAALGTTSTADQVRIGGAATGSTNVQLNLTRTGVAVLSNANGVTLVQAGSGSSANAFTLNSALVDQGLVQYGIAYNPTTFAFNLVATPAAAVYRNLLSAASVRNLWLQSADAWTGHMRELRDNIAANGAGGAGGRFWVQALGQVEERRGSRSFSFNGLTTPTNLGFKQDYFGGQVGLDIGGGGGEGEGGFAFGVTGGYLNSTLNFANSADRINYDAINGGVYASLDSGIFFVNLLGKYDYYWSNNRTNFYNVDAEGSVYGARGEVGLRLGERVWFEPAASLSYTHSDFDDITTAQGNFTFDDADGLRGKGGARLGFTTDVGPSKATLYAGGNYVREFRGRDRVAFVSGGQTVNFQNLRARDYGEGIVGLNVGSDQGRVSGFFEGRYANGGDYEGYGGRAGMRLRF